MRRTLLVLLISLLLTGLVIGYAKPPDSDGDGLTDPQEQQLGTDPHDPDTDGDGLPDGAEYFSYFTDPLQPDSDGDGIADNTDQFPQKLFYQDLTGVMDTTNAILQDNDDLRIHQQVIVRVGNVITIDWIDHFNPDFTVKEAEMTISYDFLDPNKPDWSGSGYYRVDQESGTAEILLPSYSGPFHATIPWSGQVITMADWIYHLYSKPFQPDQEWHFRVFYHELLPWGEDPFFAATAKVTGVEKLPLETKLGYREYQVYVVECTLTHATFKDPYFRQFLGENPRFTLRAYITTDKDIPLRYTTLYFRITPAKSIGFSDSLLVH